MCPVILVLIGSVVVFQVNLCGDSPSLQHRFFSIVVGAPVGLHRVLNGVEVVEDVFSGVKPPALIPFGR